MKKVKPHGLFGLLSGLSLIISLSLLFIKNAPTTINVHDTYYVIHNSHIFYIIFLIFISFSLIYWSFDKIGVSLIKKLTNIHVYITICGSIICVFMSYFIPNKGSESSIPFFDDVSNYNLFITLIVLFIVIAQLIFILNFIVSSIKQLIG